MSVCKEIKAYVEVEGVYETNYGKIITASASATANGNTYEIALQNAYKVAKDIAFLNAENEAHIFNQDISYTININQVLMDKKEISKISKTITSIIEKKLIENTEILITKENENQEKQENENQEKQENENQEKQENENQEKQENKIILQIDNKSYTNKEVKGIIIIKNDEARLILNNTILFVSSLLKDKSGYVIVNSITLLENSNIYEFNVSWINKNQNKEIEWNENSKITFFELDIR
jgi:hypothetical protein